MKKMAMVMAILCCAGAAMAALTSRSYVQDGLIVQYDGINNVGHGVAHSNSATTWVDLTGNGNDGTVNAAVGWSENGWTNSTGNIQPVTVGSGLAAAIASAGKFSAQMTFTPTSYRASKTSLFGQNPNTANQFNIERNTDGYIGFYAGDPVWKRKSSSSRVMENTWAPITLSVAGGVVQYSFNVYNGANPNAPSKYTVNVTDSTKVLAFNQNCQSIIGGYAGSDDMAFRGTYNAFRLYNRELTEDEIKLNAAIDAVRFNGGDPSDYAILANYTFDDMGYRYYDFTATAEVGGKIHVAGAADATNATLPASAGTAATFTAVPDAGYVFQEWTGDISAITTGSLITPTISVKSANCGEVRAVFRKRGTALDGMVFDLDMQDVNGNGEIESGDKIGNAMKVSASDAANAYTKAWSTTDNATFSAYSPKFSTLNVAGPMTPFTTNSQTCLVFPQHVEGDTCFNSRVELTKCGIMGEVATFFVRFKWDGAVAENKNCNITLLLNGCTDGWWANMLGYVLTIRTYANKPHGGYLNVGGAQKRTGNWSNPIPSGSWVDCFMSVYPSPTTPGLSNGDLYFCMTPSFDGSAFAKPELVHYHFGDGAEMPTLRATASTYAGLRFGCDRSDIYSGSDFGQTAFRGAIAAVKGWRRLLTEDEMWCVMAGVHGGVFHVGSPNGSPDEFGASGTEATFDPATMAWQKMKKSLTAADRTLTISMPLTAENKGLAKMLVVKPLFDGVGASCPVSVTANGVEVGDFDLMLESDRTILLRGAAASRDANGKLVIAIERPAGCEGTLSFDAMSLVGSWQIGKADGSKAEMKEEGKGVPQVAIMGDPIYKHVQRSLTKVCSTLSLVFDVTENVPADCKWRYSTKFLDPRDGYEQPIHIEVNGTTIWTNADVGHGTEVNEEIGASLLQPGLNVLKLCYDSPGANWISIDYHSLRLVPPPLGLSITIR